MFGNVLSHIRGGLQREAEEAQFAEWEKKADEFHLEQARLRAKIRTAEGR
jgi:hypothetical protein